MTLTGLSSPLYVWNPTSQTFLLRGIEHGKKGQLIIEYMDEIISER